MPFKLFELGCGSTEKSQIIIDEILRHESSLEYGPNDLSAGKKRSSVSELSACVDFIIYSFGMVKQIYKKNLVNFQG